MAKLNLYNYIADNNPGQANLFIQEYGHKASNSKPQIAESLKSIARTNGDEAIANMMLIHPDRDAVLESAKNLSCDACADGNCDCDKCKNKNRFRHADADADEKAKAEHKGLLLAQLNFQNILVPAIVISGLIVVVALATKK